MAEKSGKTARRGQASRPPFFPWASQAECSAYHRVMVLVSRMAMDSRATELEAKRFAAR